MGNEPAIVVQRLPYVGDSSVLRAECPEPDCAYDLQGKHLTERKARDAVLAHWRAKHGQ